MKTDTAHQHMADAKAEIEDNDFEMFAEQCRNWFERQMAAYGPHLFTVEFTDKGFALNDEYLDSFEDPFERQHHNCTACRHFIRRYGKLVFIDEHGGTIPAIWPKEYGDMPARYQKAADELYRAVQLGKVSGVFLSRETVLGKPETFDEGLGKSWTHFAVNNPHPFRHAIQSAGQKMAEKREHFGTMYRAIIDFPAATVDAVIKMMEDDELTRSEKFIGPAKFLREAIDKLSVATVSSPGWNNILWKIVASAGPGYLTPRSSVMGSLLSDLVEGVPIEDAKRRFAEKMHPLKYNRPQSAPSMGQILEANKLVEKLGVTPSLQRRFARFEEIPKIWPGSGSIAETLIVKEDGLVPESLTFVEFRDRIMPKATAIMAKILYTNPLGAFVTATNPDAPPIFKWDREDARNPVNWYLYHGGSPAHRWGLQLGWAKVTGIAEKPWTWNNPPGAFAELGVGAMFIIEGARDTGSTELALFPEMLRSELHPVRKTVEQYSKSNRIAGAEHSTACGLLLDKNGMPNPIVAMVDGEAKRYLLTSYA